MRNIEEDHRLNLKLPKPNALPGQVLKHIFSVLESHLRRHTPSIYKIGLTHCPLWRFHNHLYGYVREKQKWEGMTIVFVSHESTGPAFAEAAAIQKHLGIPVAYICFFCMSTLGFDVLRVYIVFFLCLCLYIYIRDSIYLYRCIYMCVCLEFPSHRSGQPGCYNIRDGGETVHTGDGGPYMTYFVYRSFARESNAHLMLRS